MRILLTTFDPIFLLPPTHPSGSCGSTVHARAWSWAGLRLVRAARGFGGVGVGVKSPQRHSSLAPQGKCHETISMCHGAPRKTRQRTRARVARTLAARRRCRLPCSPKGNICDNESRPPPLRGPQLPIPPSRDRSTESPPFEEFPLRGLPFPFPLRGTVQRSPLPSRSFPFEGFPSLPPSRDRNTESPPFEEFPLRGLPFPFPFRGTVNGVPSLRGVSPSRASLTEYDLRTRPQTLI